MSPAAADEVHGAPALGTRPVSARTMMGGPRLWHGGIRAHAADAEAKESIDG